MEAWFSTNYLFQGKGWGNKPNLLWPNGLQNEFAIRMKDTWRLKVEQVDTYAKVNKINMYIIYFNMFMIQIGHQLITHLFSDSTSKAKIIWKSQLYRWAYGSSQWTDRQILVHMSGHGPTLKQFHCLNYDYKVCWQNFRAVILLF